MIHAPKKIAAALCMFMCVSFHISCGLSSVMCAYGGRLGGEVFCFVDIGCEGSCEDEHSVVVQSPEFAPKLSDDDLIFRGMPEGRRGKSVVLDPPVLCQQCLLLAIHVRAYGGRLGVIDDSCPCFVHGLTFIHEGFDGKAFRAGYSSQVGGRVGMG
jgi:hypothetical protein